MHKSDLTAWPEAHCRARVQFPGDEPESNDVIGAPRFGAVETTVLRSNYPPT